MIMMMMKNYDPIIAQLLKVVVRDTIYLPSSQSINWSQLLAIIVPSITFFQPLFPTHKYSCHLSFSRNIITYPFWVTSLCMIIIISMQISWNLEIRKSERDIENNKTWQNIFETANNFKTGVFQFLILFSI